MQVRRSRISVPHPLSRPRRFGLAYGFTLIELIIALALIGLIVLLLFSGLRLGTRVWEGVETAAERTAAPRLAYNFLARMLIQARPVQVTFDSQDVLVFNGDAENLEFVAPLSEHVGTPGLYVLRLSLERHETARLVLTRWLLHPDVLDGFGGIPQWEPFIGATTVADRRPLQDDLADGAYGTAVLLDGVAALKISYFGVPEGQEDAEWTAEWLQEDHMPLAIRVHLSTEQQAWPDMLVRLPQLDSLAGRQRP